MKRININLNDRKYELNMNIYKQIHSEGTKRLIKSIIALNDKMTIYEGYTVENRGFEAIEVPPKRKTK